MTSSWISRGLAVGLVIGSLGCGSHAKKADAGADAPVVGRDAPADTPVEMAPPDAADAEAGPGSDAPSLPPDAPPDAGAADTDGAPPEAPPDSGGAEVICGAPSDPRNCGICGRDCSLLPHVKPSAVTTCRNGTCVLPADACVQGFAHCTTNGNQGCETDVTTPGTCGGCSAICPAATRLCAAPAAAPAMCVATCEGTGLTACGPQCVDVQSHPSHCGACNARCSLFGAMPACVAGKCEIARCLAGSADCDARPGCETLVTTFYDCGGCGRSCEAANAAGQCEKSACRFTCRPGYGDCDPSKPDCEKTLDTAAACGACGKACPADRPLCGGPPGQEACLAACAPSAPDLCGTTCTSLMSDPRHCGACGKACDGYQICVGGRCSPRYVHTDVVKEGTTPTTLAMGSDGSYVVAGTFRGDLDFNPGPGEDVQRSIGAAFVTKYNADGSYAWTRSFPSASVAYQNAVAVAPDGKVIVTGSYTGSVDFDPGPALDLHQTVAREAFVLSLDPAGTWLWARTFAVANTVSGSGGVGVAAAKDGTLVVVGTFGGRVDFNPGPAADMRDSEPTWGLGPASDMYAVKLSAAGQLQWARTYRGALEPTALKVHPNDTFWIGGRFSGTVDFDPSDANDERSPLGAMDGFAARLDADGNHQGALTISLGQTNTVRTVAFDGDGSAYLGGDVSGLSFVVKVTAQGMLQWTQTGPAWLLLAAAPGGGLLTGGTDVNVAGIEPAGVLARKRDAAGKFQWAIPAPIPMVFGYHLAAADATKLIVVGLAAHGGDYDPGAGTDLISDPGLFITRYAF